MVKGKGERGKGIGGRRKELTLSPFLYSP